MSFRRVVMTLILAAAAVLAGCGEEDVVPEELLAPALPEVRVEADGCVVTLTARFRNEADLASVKEFGFYFGRDEVSMDCLKVTKVVGLEYSLIKEDLDYSTTYLFKVWVGNGREEKASELKEVTTGEKPVGPDPPVPAVRNIAFKDPVVKEVCVRNWDLDGDGELSMAEAAQVTDLGMVFKRNEKITSFEELEHFTGLVEVADSAFGHCTNLRDIKLPESVRVIGQRAFEECGNMLLRKLPDNLATVKTHAFAGCGKMPLTSLPETLTLIENWAFARCGSMRLTSLPSALTLIDSGVFSECYGVAPEKLPENLCYIGEWAFFNARSFNPKELPSGVREIGKYAFQGCESLTWTQLPSDLYEIGDYAFFYCWKVRFSSLPKRMIRVNAGVFENCVSITSLTLPEGLTSIGPNAFKNCKFFEITIPESVVFIGAEAFNGCSRLRSVTDLPPVPPEMEDTYIGDNANVMYVPSSSMEAYRIARNWSEWKSKYRTLDDL